MHSTRTSAEPAIPSAVPPKRGLEDTVVAREKAQTGCLHHDTFARAKDTEETVETERVYEIVGGLGSGFSATIHDNRIVVRDGRHALVLLYRDGGECLRLFCCVFYAIVIPAGCISMRNLGYFFFFFLIRETQ